MTFKKQFVILSALCILIASSFTVFAQEPSASIEDLQSVDEIVTTEKAPEGESSQYMDESGALSEIQEQLQESTVETETPVSKPETPDSSYVEYFEKEVTFRKNVKLPYDENQGRYFIDEDSRYLYWTNDLLNLTADDLILNEPVNYFSVVNDAIYAIVDNKVVKVGLSGSNPEVLIETDEPLYQIYADQDIVYFVKGTRTILRYHINSKTLDEIMKTEENIVNIEPKSNWKFTVYTEDSHKGAMHFKSFSYNSNTHKQTGMIEIDRSMGTLLGSDVSTQDVSPKKDFTATINKVKVPFPNYGHGKTYGGTFDGGSTCMGFARFAYYTIWGDHYNTSGTYTETATNKACGSADIAESYLTNVKLGSIISTVYTAGNNHAMILVGKDKNGITVYHSNWDFKDTIYFHYFTWSDFDTAFTKFNYIRENK